MEHILEQDIHKGYSVVVVDPKGDIDLFSKITHLAGFTTASQWLGNWVAKVGVNSFRVFPKK